MTVPIPSPKSEACARSDSASLHSLTRRRLGYSLAASIPGLSGCSILPHSELRFQLSLTATCDNRTYTDSSVLAVRAIEEAGLFSRDAPWRTEIVGRGPMIDLGENGLLCTLLEPSRSADSMLNRTVAFLPYVLWSDEDSSARRVDWSHIAPKPMLDRMRQLPDRYVLPDALCPQVAWFWSPPDASKCEILEDPGAYKQSSGRIMRLSFSISHTNHGPSKQAPQFADWLLDILKKPRPETGCAPGHCVSLGQLISTRFSNKEW
jgi:hypothetical protein